MVQGGDRISSAESSVERARGAYLARERGDPAGNRGRVAGAATMLEPNAPPPGVALAEPGSAPPPMVRIVFESVEPRLNQRLGAASCDVGPRLKPRTRPPLASPQVVPTGDSMEMEGDMHKEAADWFGQTFRLQLCGKQIGSQGAKNLLMAAYAPPLPRPPLWLSFIQPRASRSLAARATEPTRLSAAFPAWLAGVRSWWCWWSSSCPRPPVQMRAAIIQRCRRRRSAPLLHRVRRW